MTTLTITLDPEVFQAAQREADLRRITVEQYAASVISDALLPVESTRNKSTLLHLMKEGILGDLGPLPTREEIYAERTRWPR